MDAITRFFNEKKLAKSTEAVYKSAFSLYQDLNNLTMDELLEEADLEEEKGVRWKHRTIKTRLIEFRNYLYANKGEGTVKRYLGSVKTFYRHFEIELHDLPTFNSKQIDKIYKMDYEDLITTEELIDAYYEANNLFKCMIVFGISTGLSKIDMLNLTVDDFLNACDKYISRKDDTILNKLLELKGQTVFGYFSGSRQKTDSKYTTYCSPEAAEHIVQYLIGRDAQIREKYNEALDKTGLPEKLRGSDKVFNVTKEHVTYTFKKINNKLKLDKVGKFGKFRCHMLRKYHASTLLNSEILTWTVEEIDSLQGRSMDMTHQAYFKNSKDKLFKKYYECVDELMLFKSIHTIDEETVQKLESENRFYKKEIVKNEQKLEEQQERINEIIRNQRELEAMLGI